MRFAALLSCALLLLAAGACARPTIPRARLDGWHVADAAGVRLAGDVSREEMQRLADDLALFDATFAHLAGWSRAARPTPVRVFLIRDRTLARHFHLGERIAGWALPTLDGGFSAVAADRDYDSMRSTLFHEYTHLLLRQGRRAPLPPCYDEGLASFFGTLDARAGAVVVGAPPLGAVFRVSSRGPLPLAELFEGNIWERDTQGIADFYATSWALSHYLLITPKGRREMARLVERLAEGASPEQAQQAAFGRSTETLETELRTHVAYLARGVPAEVVLDAGALDVRTAGRAAPLPFADAAGGLGTLALRRAGEADGSIGLATRLLEMAGSRGPRDAHTEATLAEALALAGSPDAAEDALRRAIALGADDAMIQIRAGRVELARADADDAASAERLEVAESHFRRALELEPESAAAWFGLGRTLRRAERPDEAHAALLSARRRGWSPALDLTLGKVELERGDTQRALALLGPLARNPHRGTVSKEASRLLEKAGLLTSEPDGRH